MTLEEGLGEGIQIVLSPRFVSDAPFKRFQKILLWTFAILLLGLITVFHFLSPVLRVGGFSGLVLAAIYCFFRMTWFRNQQTLLVLKKEGMEFVQQRRRFASVKNLQIIQVPLQFLNFNGVPHLDDEGLLRIPVKVRRRRETIWLGEETMSPGEVLRRLGYFLPAGKIKTDWLLAQKREIFDLSLDTLAIGKRIPQHFLEVFSRKTKAIASIFQEIWEIWKRATISRNLDTVPREEGWHVAEKAIASIVGQGGEPWPKSPLLLALSDPDRKVLAFRISLLRWPPLCVYSGNPTQEIGRYTIPLEEGNSFELDLPVDSKMLEKNRLQTWGEVALAALVFGFLAFITWNWHYLVPFPLIFLVLLAGGGKALPFKVLNYNPAEDLLILKFKNPLVVHDFWFYYTQSMGPEAVSFIPPSHEAPWIGDPAGRKRRLIIILVVMVLGLGVVGVWALIQFG